MNQACGRAEPDWAVPVFPATGKLEPTQAKVGCAPRVGDYHFHRLLQGGHIAGVQRQSAGGFRLEFLDHSPVHRLMIFSINWGR